VNPNTKPNFLIVGAAKSGTTSLYHYLNQHSQVFMPEFKEPQFFVSKLVHNKVYKCIENEEDYFNLFASTESYKCKGEASVFYLYYYEEAIKNILHYLGRDTKIIIILRNPVERAYSAYKHVVSGNPDLMMSFDEALKFEEVQQQCSNNTTPMADYKRMGLYYDSVRAYMNIFANVHVMLHNDLKDNPKEEVAKLFNFLDVFPECVDVKKRHNTGRQAWKSKWMGNLVLKDNVFKRFIKKAPFFEVVKKKMVNKTQVKFKPISPECQKILLSYYENDTNMLSSLIHRDLNIWKDNS